MVVSRRLVPPTAPPPRSHYEPPDRRKGSLGRYTHRGDERSLEHLPQPSLNARTAIVSISSASANPADKGKRDLAIVNRRVDVLEYERSRGLITEAGYQAGRTAQAMFERARGPGSSNWQGGSRVDAYTSTELRIIHGLEDAREVTAYMGWMASGKVLGMIDARLVRRILWERLSYADAAHLQGKSGERGISYVAQRFRDGLERLAECSAAKGAARRIEPI